jgi:hypothetical protein
MALQPCRSALLLAVFVVSAFLCASTRAKTAEATYCVTCANPDQTYLCKVTTGGSSSQASEALKLYCVVRTAKEGNHSSCSAERSSSGCHGVEKVYSYDGPLPEDLAANPRVKSLAKRYEKEQKAFEKPKGREADTLFKLTRQGWRNARDRLSGSPDDAPLPDASQAQDQPTMPVPAEQDPERGNDDQPNRMQRASNAVGGFARKSYNCVRSLFRKCSGGETAEPNPPQ